MKIQRHLVQLLIIGTFKTEDNVPAGKLSEPDPLVRDTDSRSALKCHGSPTLVTGPYGAKAAVPKRSKQ